MPCKHDDGSEVYSGSVGVIITIELRFGQHI